jgi:hypothetical protein
VGKEWIDDKQKFTFDRQQAILHLAAILLNFIVTVYSVIKPSTKLLVLNLLNYVE